MVKGMTKRIVEIKDTGSNLFERAIFFVRMDMSQNTTEYTLSKEAEKIIDKFCAELKLTRASRGMRLWDLLKLAASAVAGAMLTILVIQLVAIFS